MTQDDDIAWYDQAACRSLGWKEFFDGDGAGSGRQVCVTCPVRARCLEFAINNNITSGIWGGLSPLERRTVPPSRTWVV